MQYFFKINLSLGRSIIKISFIVSVKNLHCESIVDYNIIFKIIIIKNNKVSYIKNCNWIWTSFTLSLNKLLSFKLNIIYSYIAYLKGEHCHLK